MKGATMTLREGVIGFVIAAGVLLSLGFYRWAAESERSAEEAKRDATRRIKSLQLEAKASAGVVESDLPVVTNETPSPAIAEKPVEKTPDVMPAAVPMPISVDASKLVNSSALKRARRRASLTGMEATYGDLLASWGLEGEARQKMLELFIERDLAKTNGTIEIMHAGLSPEEIALRVMENQRRADETLAQQLTPAQVAGLQEYERTMPDRMMQKETDREVSELGIDQTRSPAIRDILLGEKRRESEESAQELATVQAATAGTADGGRPSARIEVLVKVKRASNERALTQTRPLLTDAEYEKLRMQQEAGLSPLETALQLMSASGEGPASK